MNRHNPVGRKRQMHGLTLVELMVALTLGLIVIGALVAVFVSNNQNYRQNEAIATLQDNARFALDSLSRDLAMAGYWGGVRALDAGAGIFVSNAARSALATGDDCGPNGAAFDLSTPIVFRDHTDTTAINTQFACLQTADIAPDTDVLMIRRVSGVIALSNTGTGNTGAVEANRFYVQTNQSVGSLFRAGASFSISALADCAPPGGGATSNCLPGEGPPAAAPYSVHAYTPQLYYVRAAPTGGFPTLCRRMLDDSTGTPTLREDCLADGVENLQIEWGVGSNTVENYTSTPTAAELLQARTARIHLLVRATSRNVQASQDAKTFTMANFTSAAEAGALRRVFTTTVQLKNLQP